jgi:hypothetical protein
MRKLAMLLSAVAAASLLSATPGAAQYEGPWCVYTVVGAGFVAENCQMRSYEMCRANMFRSGSYCTQNPRYVPYTTGQTRSKRKARKRYY